MDQPRIIGEPARLMRAMMAPIFEVARRITRNCSPLYLGGGAVRYFLLFHESYVTEYDFFGDFDLDQIQSDFPDWVIGRWDDVSTIKLRVGSLTFDFIATTDLGERASRSDITISNIYVRDDGVILDYVGGWEDLWNARIKIVDPEKKIREDPSRILRVYRIAREMGMWPEEETQKAVDSNAHLLSSCEYTVELQKILTLPPPLRNFLLEELRDAGVGQYLSYDCLKASETIEVRRIGDRISRYEPIDDVVELFGEVPIYLVGGATRDAILGKPIKDFDFKIYLKSGNTWGIQRVLESRGYRRTENVHLNDGEFYINLRMDTVSITLRGYDVDFSEMVTPYLPVLLPLGDINLNCCVYNAHTRKIENPEVIGEIKSRVLRFCDPEEARRQPLIVLSALKQISRMPDVVIPEDTRGIILASISSVVRFSRENPQMRYKLEALSGNLNSEEVYAIFAAESYPDFFDGFPKKKTKLRTSSRYVSLTVEELTDEDRAEIETILRSSYGNMFDESKLFPHNVNSVVFERGPRGISACCLIDSERIYSVAAPDGANLLAMLKDIVGNNYNVWATVGSESPHILAVLEEAGLHVETSPEVVRKILHSKYPKYVRTSEILNSWVPLFSKGSFAGQDYSAQFLVRS